MKHTARGFTIVELLIVIVVIAILAAISIVAYSGVSNSANDSAVQSDMRQLAQTTSMYHAENGTYPTAITQIRTQGSIEIAKGSYAEYFTGVLSYNYIYCWSNEQKTYALAARSKSGDYFQYRDGRVSRYEGSTTLGSASVTLCSNLGVDEASRIWFYEGNSWRA